MPINVQYGPIAAGLGLAQQAGQAARQQVGFQQDMEFQRLVQAAQAQADQRHANEISTALHAESLSSENDRASAQFQQQAIDSQAREQQAATQQQANNQYRQQALALSQQKATAGQDMAQQRLQLGQDTLDRKTGNDQLRQDAISQLPPEIRAEVQATGRLPYDNSAKVQANDLRSLQTEHQMLQQQMNQDTKLRADPLADPKMFMQDDAVAAAKTRMQQIEQQLTQQNQTAAAKPAVAPAAVKQIIDANQQQAGGQQGSPPVINTAQEYAALPSGTVYVDGQTGKKAIKP